MMDVKVNGILDPNPEDTVMTNGDYYDQAGGSRLGEDDATLAALEAQLPVVYDGQVEMREVLSRMSQAIYAELSEMAETLPSMSDAARKRTIADWVVKTKKQAVKLYAVIRWARDAGDVQKAMNITAFLLNQNQQFENVIRSIAAAKESLAPARLRNHDLLTSLDVLTTGTYLRLPSQIKKFFITPPPLNDDEVRRTLTTMEEKILYRLRVREIIPTEMSDFRIGDGRVFFVLPDLFETSLSLMGAQKSDGWFFVHVEFLHGVAGDSSVVQEFPRKPMGRLKQDITDEANGRLAYYIHVPPDPNAPPDYEPPPRPQLPSDTMDTPLVRLFNFLQLMAMTYQLEILFHQAQRLRSLGWSQYLNLERSKDGKAFTSSYWVRPFNNANRNQRNRIPTFGGTLSISLEQTFAHVKIGGGPQRTSKDRILAILEQRSKLGGAKPSDEVETFRFVVKWEPAKGAFGVPLSADLDTLEPEELVIDPQKLDFESLLQKVIKKHVHSILISFERMLLHGPSSNVFAYAGEVSILHEDGIHILRIHMCADEHLTVSFDIRTGRLSVKDTGGLSASGKSRKYASLTDLINRDLERDPFMIFNIIVQARFESIVDSADQKAQYMGLQTFRGRNLLREEYTKFGTDTRAWLFIQLTSYPIYYLVLVVSESEFKFALVSTRTIPDHPTYAMVLHDICWLDYRRIHTEDVLAKEILRTENTFTGPFLSGFGPFDMTLGRDRFKLETETLRELYAYCCARVAYTKIEQQLKAQAIPYSYISPTSEPHTDLSYMQSSLVQSVPGLCVQSTKILERAPAAEAAMPNVRFIPLNWWSNKKAQVVTCVKLKQVQQPLGKHAGSSAVIRLSKRIIYDTREAIVSFLSENVDNCVNEFLEEWAKVSKMVVIANEVSQMSKMRSWAGVRLLSFDLQKVEFAYSQDYIVSITCTEHITPAGSKSTYELEFSRIRKERSACGFLKIAPPDDLFNPHSEAQEFLKRVLRHGPQLSASLKQLVGILRDTLPLATVIEGLREKAEADDEALARKIGVDAFPKGAGWYRITYGDSRHALDLRSMTSRRVTILDASLPTINPVIALRARARPPPRPKGKASKAASLVKDGSDSSMTPSSPPVGVLLPIPNFAATLLDIIRKAVKTNSQDEPVSANGGLRSKECAQKILKTMDITPVDNGIICSVDVVASLVPAVHERILDSLTSSDLKPVAAEAPILTAQAITS